MKLVFDTTATKDEINTTYSALLNKFNKEGKLESYKNVDLQYQKIKNSKLWDFLQRNWWYYGYHKEYVWAWTFGFLVLFFSFNMNFWPQMSSTYPVIADHNKRDGKKYKSLNFLREAFVIFLFTLYVFFSLRISLDKLKFKKIRYVAFFFLQYIVLS